MTREEFLETHRHYLAGLVLDALATARERTPEMQAMWIRNVMKLIDARMAIMYADLVSAQPVATHPLRKFP